MFRASQVLVAVLGVAVVGCTHPAPPPVPTPSVAAPVDPAIAAIDAVRVRFQAAIVARDQAAMLDLMVAPEVPFRARVVDGGKLVALTAADFARDIGGATTAWAEDFEDVRIAPADGLATLDARYRFLDDGKVTNHGREIWTLIETAEGWKITSVSWSVIVD